MRWSACCAPLVTSDLVGLRRHAKAAEVRGDAVRAGPAGRTGHSRCRRSSAGRSSRTAAAIASATIEPAGSAPMVSSMASSTSGVEQADGRQGRGRRRGRRHEDGVRVHPLERGQVRLCQSGPSRRDSGAAPLAAAGQAGQAKAVVRGDDRRPAEGQLAGQLALRRQAGPGRQEAEVDGSCEGRGELLVERIRTVRPRADQVGEHRGGDHRLPFQSTCAGLAIGLVVHARYDAIHQQSNVKSAGLKRRHWTGKEGRKTC